MPSVPVYEGDQVRLAPVTSAKMQGPSNPEAFGVGVGRALQQAGQQIGSVTEALAQHHERVTELNVKDADAAFSKFLTEHAYGTPDQPGVLARKGRAALTEADAARELAAKKAEEYAAKLKDPFAQRMFRSVVQRRLAAFEESVGRHVAVQAETAWQETSAARIANATDLGARGAGDPAMQRQAVTTILGEANEHQKRYGWTAEQREAWVTETLSPMHANVALTLAANGDPAGALKYVEENAGQISAKTLTSLKADLQQDAARADALTTVRAAFETGGEEVAQAVIDKETDPAKVQQMQSWLDHRRGMQRREEAETEEKAIDEAAAFVEMGGDPDDLPIATRKAIARHMPTLRNMAKSRLEGTLPQENGLDYLKALELQATNPDQFKRLDILGTYAGRVTRAELAKLLNDQKAILNGDQPNKELNQQFNAAWGVVAPIASAYLNAVRGPVKAKREGELRSFVMSEVMRRKAAGQQIDSKAMAEIAQLAMLPGVKDGLFGGPREDRRRFFEGGTPSPAQLRAAAPQLWDQAVYALRIHSGTKEAVTPSVVAERLSAYEASGFKVLVPYKEIPPRDVERIKKMPGVKTKADIEAVYTHSLLIAVRQGQGR